MMIKKVFFCSLIILLLFSLFVYFTQRDLIYFPAKERPDRHLFHADDMEELKLTTTDKLSLNAWYKPPVEARATLLYLHGNAGHIGSRMRIVRQFLSAGFGVLIVDYRGYGGNKGIANEDGLYIDARTAVQFLQQKGVSSSHLVIYGESLGSGVATKMAEEYSSCALILQSPFSSLPDVARYQYPWIFLPPWDKFDSLSRIKKIKTPLLILHGKKDVIVPFKQGEALYHEANPPKRFIAFASKGHSDLWGHPFYNQVLDFIGAHCS